MADESCNPTGVAMHPLEQLVYFGVFALLWRVPVHQRAQCGGLAKSRIRRLDAADP